MRRDLAAMHPDATAGTLQPPHPRPPPSSHTMSTTEPTTALVIPLTGEAISLQAPTETLGTHLLEIRELQAQLGDAKRAITNEIVNRLDHQATWTQHLPGITVKTQSPQPVEEFDELALRSELLELVDAGQLAVEAVDSAIEPVVIYKTRKAGINALRKLGGQVAEIVNRHAREVAKPRYVTVQRNGAK